MLVYEKNNLMEEIQQLGKKHGINRNALIPILQDIQAKYHGISDFAQQEIGRMLSIHPVEVYSVVSFYSFLNSNIEGRNVVRLCKTVSCDLAGKCDIVKAIERELGIKFGETTKDKRISLEYTNCLGMCDQGPAMIVNERVYGKLTPEAAVTIINEIK
ncbi:MAG: NAD(P)H-dependent oxidoreductase subunit E [Ignavibacteriales bacterium]|nr:NAD(P)H-dependent oxidoreductase subunit E [Ignavibacteriales bacterium]